MYMESSILRIRRDEVNKKKLPEFVLHRELLLYLLLLLLPAALLVKMFKLVPVEFQRI